ncbi:DUF1513 domain-containing protein [Flaviflagellibacter deserti]|uniref:DUF1513 domain-containing protein n=1 Tax=Flaviflagellibacter deserti TaxID=2267266 RepID=A0ABV9Z424_9HYPH
MQIDRRSFMLALASSFVAGGMPAFARERLYVSACNDAAGVSNLAVFTADGGTLFKTQLPDRGHDIALSPASPDLVVFARRPGDWMAVIDRRNGAVKVVVRSPEGRHFYGHGTYSGDGTLLYATENNLETGQGVLGVYDTAANYRRIGEQPTHGIGPHDVAFMPGKELLLVANGGARTDPASGREILNKHRMEPSLALVDPRSGEARYKVDFGSDLTGLSVRHLAVASDGEAAFACQYEGDPEEAPPLVGLVSKDGRTRMLGMPDEDLYRLNNYLGAICLDGSERLIAATSPRGGMAAFWDRSTGRYLGLAPMPDVCGVAAAPEAGTFIVSSGNAGVKIARAETHDLARVGGSDLDRYMWDNHIEIVT